MATVIKLLLIVIILWWIGRFFSPALNQLWSRSVGASFVWIRQNGSLMMRWIVIAGLLLAVVIIYQWQ
ncbi:hypothetical protein TKWG_16190 [Advenella kashmirensis WT001]|uniref:Uncharacterized protein n=1 Tax=Advenella kashmirensis (strain DSM 17095 / LMG 22695 / WT001) TaxID=1036672 RepID=I3UDW1_ADVKW|nr:hypothetical protein [Advenella kashmirensis]AFK63199.1 hypothetical protein TKWG_16190 [Advenella kashmirensis WT001]